MYSDVLRTDKFVVYNLRRSFADVVHSCHPHHLIFSFELFGHTLPRCHFLCQPREENFRLGIDLRKVCVQLTGNIEIEI